MSLALTMETYKFVKTNTGIILWDYQITRNAFVTAQERVDEGKMTDEQIALELAAQAFKPIWQTRDLRDPLLISSKWYSHQLHDFLFECFCASDLSHKERKALIGKIADVSEELNKIEWDAIRTNESSIGQKEAIFKTIENVGKILDRQ